MLIFVMLWLVCSMPIHLKRIEAQHRSACPRTRYTDFRFYLVH